jgi:hypothetical protein
MNMSSIASTIFVYLKISQVYDQEQSEIVMGVRFKSFHADKIFNE